MGVPIAKTPPILVQKVVLACYSLNTSCITNFKLLASVAVEMNRGSQNLAVPNVEEPHICRGGSKKFFLVQLSPISPPVNDVIKCH